MNKTNKAFYGLPNEVLFCKNCVISNQRPSSTIEFKNKIEGIKETINFDNENVCSACRYSEIKEGINWQEREQSLIELSKSLKKFRENNPYDCIVPGSGGKDSAYTAHILKYKYGFKPLTVTWAPHLYTNIGWQNFQNWMHEGGLDNILFTPNGKLHRLLTKLAFENLLHPFQPFIVGQRIIGPKFGSKFNIPIIFYGENQAEYGNNINDNFSEKMNQKFFMDNIKNRKDILLGGVSIDKIIKDYKFNFSDFDPYLPINENEYNKQLEVHYLGYYLKWDPQECFYYASENTGFKANDARTEGSYSKYSSIDDKIDPFHYYTTYIKFGLGRSSYDAAQEIRNGKITREEGVKLIELYDSEFPQKYFKEFLKYIDITENKFFDIIDKFRSPHLWKFEGNKWILKFICHNNN